MICIVQQNTDGYVPFCTLSHSKKISSPPLTLPLFLLTRQILSSAVFGAPDDIEENTVNMHMQPPNICNKSNRSDCILHIQHRCSEA